MKSDLILDKPPGGNGGPGRSHTLPKVTQPQHLLVPAYLSYPHIQKNLLAPESHVPVSAGTGV